MKKIVKNLKLKQQDSDENSRQIIDQIKGLIEQSVS